MRDFDVTNHSLNLQPGAQITLGPKYCLGIESSCDDTAAAVLAFPASAPKILSFVVRGQTDLHADFGGVVPEIAARAHVEVLDTVIQQALDDAGVALGDIDVVAVTSGPGLIGGVLAGVMHAKAISATRGIPLIGVNHLAGHALTPRLTDGLEFPYLMLLASGGHCQFLQVNGWNSFHRLGGTIDDAPGEAFDKTARILGLAQPGGPVIEIMAKDANPKRFPLPRPLLDRPDMNLSFSGLKTAVVRARDSILQPDGTLLEQDVRDLCASFQAAVTDVLVEKSRRAIAAYLDTNPAQPAIAVAGGVAANQTLRKGLQDLAAAHNLQFVAPPLALCTDNAAMIAFAGIEAFEAGHTDELTLSARPRWPLDPSQAALVGHGKKGAKA